ncbi:MAG: ribonuclease HII [Candidatus Saccharibacteria bacterium]|nr:ribonuclease HII [Candidatus Saccharibacteria bacterium]
MIGIDEVGRGCWAGPLLVVAAQARSDLPTGLADSKTLSKNTRNKIYAEIIRSCSFSEGWVQPEEIDNLGLTQAMKLGVARALLTIGVDHDEDIIMDGHINYCPSQYVNVQTVVKADSLHPIVSAASIYAKVTRDAHMTRLAQFYPMYGFEHHAGYGTELHRSALRVHGVSKIHRLSYKPVKASLAT